MTTDQPPDTLRELLGDEPGAVRPLAPIWQRLVAVAVVFAVVAAASLLVSELRFDIGAIPMWLSWGCSLLELLVGVIVIGLALREAIPGAAVPLGTVTTVVGAALVLQVCVGVATWLHTPGAPFSPDWLTTGVVCLKHDSTMVLPVLVVTLWLVYRALPLRAPIAGLLGGTGAALAGDSLIHLLCPMSDLRHVLAWHSGAIVVFMLFGWAAGRLYERLRWR